MKRADGTDDVLDARRTIFGTMVYGGVNINQKEINQDKIRSSAQGNTKNHDIESENTLNTPETP